MLEYKPSDSCSRNRTPSLVVKYNGNAGRIMPVCSDCYFKQLIFFVKVVTIKAILKNVISLLK